MAIALYIVASLALTGSIGAFLLYVPMMPFLLVAVIVMGLIAMFVMGLQLGAQFHPAAEEELEAPVIPIEIHKTAKAVESDDAVEIPAVWKPIAKPLGMSAGFAAKAAKSPDVVVPFRPQPLSARPIR